MESHVWGMYGIVVLQQHRDDMVQLFFYKQSIFDPLPENCLELFSRWSISFYCFNTETF